MKIHSSVTLERVVQATKDEMFGTENPGFCVDCGSEQDGCEPDAQGIVCEECGHPSVHGAAELLFWVVA